MKKSIIGIAIACALFMNCNEQQNNNAQQNNIQSQQTTHSTPAQELASIDVGTQLPINNVHVQETQKHLTSLANTFGKSEQEIADITFNASNMLAKKGLSYSGVRLLEIVDKDQEDMKNSGVKYEEFMTLLVIKTTRNE